MSRDYDGVPIEEIGLAEIKARVHAIRQDVDGYLPDDIPGDYVDEMCDLIDELLRRIREVY